MGTWQDKIRTVEQGRRALAMQLLADECRDIMRGQLDTDESTWWASNCPEIVYLTIGMDSAQQRRGFANATERGMIGRALVRTTMFLQARKRLDTLARLNSCAGDRLTASERSILSMRIMGDTLAEVRKKHRIKGTRIREIASEAIQKLFAANEATDDAL